MKKSISDNPSIWALGLALLASVIILGIVTSKMGVLGLIAVLFVTAFAASIGYFARGESEPGPSEDLLRKQITSLESQLAEERQIVRAMTSEIEPSDF